ncbi:MAG TPA: hypothetical protein VMU65_00110 [Candidatus Saccharimonadales bacterium]|jgi:hypothetical protein|nr:hypothetical protein [Candidatus Saccharimonadales bacterium]
MNSPPTLPYPGWSEDTVTVPAKYFEEGRLPAVCVVTGAPATSNLRRRYSTTPGWVGCLFFISWFALLIAWIATRRSASGYVPVCKAVATRVQSRHAAMVRLAALGGAAWVAIIPVSATPALSQVANPLGLALGAAGLVALVCSAVASIMEESALGVQGRVVEDGFGARWVQLRGVHPAFSRALALRLGR